MEIKVLGTGCSKCKTLERVVNEIVENTSINATVTKEEDIVKIMEYGVMATPAMVVDNQVVAKGRVPSAKEITKLLTE
ncbi:MAG: thioredoxin family protein [Bacteroidales bacterium]|jgi:small redox-active disulfide protein 2|nr:thioredoxin family protein [Bacteroidales bacterium]